ncbi:MAG TPA: hypothetical protein QGH03_01010 [Candidatus Paceibacterota bacterium]|jgi:hypothetical protein|nr:hypothetical protein [Parcubacteria group bacterium]MDP6119700.1 hypothetical protein [Candidatus Paceibacterota bacterium]HJN62798.1 hypothetical protein [Candidatus Paceibacterota bacterium]|tara:strand:+ start:568 stop:873 length:306 start_codon:yes stop_codon:yes gene_type:complete
MNRQGGLIKLIIVIIIAIIVLSYFSFDLRSIVEAPQTQDNLGYVWELLTILWVDYLSQPILYFWNNIFIDLLWETFISNFERIKAGESTDFELNTPSVEFN